ncbi:MAG: glycosyltransferase family 2 protein [Anaerolineae bacterium]|nr:glycosyltransferase family 2 protein [Anaerolineae bacterium]
MTLSKTKIFSAGIKKMIARELASLSPFFENLIELFPQKHSEQVIYSLVPAAKKITVFDEDDLQKCIANDESNIFLLDGLLNYASDIQMLLIQVKHILNRDSRLFVVAYSPYYRWLYKLANALHLRQGELPTTFLTKTDLRNLAQLTGYTVTRIKGTIYFPFTLFGIGYLINGLLAAIPFIKELAMVQSIILSPQIPCAESVSLSVVIPARNEMGNIENALIGLQNWPHKEKLEIIFVEGHSTDDTYQEILRVQEKYNSEFNIKVYQQTGKGKSDAVRLGFSQATSELLTILDADLTVPPSYLYRFYEAYLAGMADFVNGNRLLYPMEDKAMRPLNRLGNSFFAKALSYVLDIHIGDSLCGTKLFSRKDYQRYIAWREVFGDFDPFGDFELLFPAAILGSSFVDIPIPYRARTYGSTNIDRFRHGFMLLKLTTVGFVKVKLNLFNRNH